MAFMVLGGGFRGCREVAFVVTWGGATQPPTQMLAELTEVQKKHQNHKKIGLSSVKGFFLVSEFRPFLKKSFPIFN